MRILHVTHQYPPAIGGSEKYIADLSEELIVRGHQVDVFTSRSVDYQTWRNDLDSFEVQNGVNVHRFRSVRRRAFHWHMLHFGARRYWQTHAMRHEALMFLGGGPLCPGMFWQLLTRVHEYDLVHLNCLVYSHVAYGYWAARWRRTPVIVTPHAHAGQEVTYNIGYERAVMAGSDHVIAVTDAERQMLLDLGLDPWRVSVSGNGLKLEEYEAGHRWNQASARRHLGLPEEGFYMLFLGRKSDYKGVGLALKAYSALRAERPDLNFVAVGPETNYSQALWSRYGDLEGLHVRGAVPHEEKLAALQACDCLVLPSAGEAFGIVFLEAWIMGKAVVGARTPVMSSVIADGQDGLLAATGDAADLAACIARLAADPEGARRMGAQGRDKVLRLYTVPRITDRVEGIYLRVLRRRQRDKELQ